MRFFVFDPKLEMNEYTFDKISKSIYISYLKVKNIKFCIDILT